MHYIGGLVHDVLIDLQYCASFEQVADIFTKMFSERTFNIVKSLLGIADDVVKRY